MFLLISELYVYSNQEYFNMFPIFRDSDNPRQLTSLASEISHLSINLLIHSKLKAC